MGLKHSALLMFSKWDIMWNPFIFPLCGKGCIYGTLLPYVQSPLTLISCFEKFYRNLEVLGIDYDVCLPSVYVARLAVTINNFFNIYCLTLLLSSSLLLLCYNLGLCLCMFFTNTVCIYIKCVHWHICNFKHIKTVLYNISRYFFFISKQNFTCVAYWLISYCSETERKI
jgi:hypothetical protein